MRTVGGFPNLKQGELGKVADGFPEILPVRERAEILDKVLADRLENVPVSYTHLTLPTSDLV